MDFNPDDFLAQANQPASAQPQADTQLPNGNTEGGFDPDSFIKDANEEKYGTLGQQAITGLEGIAQGVAGPLAPIAEKALGVKEEDIKARQEINPITHGVGEAAGLLGSVATGVGEGAIMAKLGTAAAKATGLAEGASLASRIGSSAIQQATEMAILQSGNEVSKMVLKDPEASAQTAIANIGLASALGGVGGAAITGVVSPLWKASVGPHVEHFMNGFAGKFGGIEGREALADAEGLVAKSGLETPAEIQSIIDGSPKAQHLHSTLSQSDNSYAGRQYQDMLNNYTTKAGDKIIETLGRTPESIHTMPELDKAMHGRNMGETLVKELDQTSKPISEGYEKITNEFKELPIQVEDKRLIADKLSNKAIESGWFKAADDSQMKLVNKVLERLPRQETVADMKNFITNLRDAHPFGSDTYQAAKEIRNILTESQENSITEGIMRQGGSSEAASAKLAEYSNLKDGYSKLMDKIDGLNEHLRVGKYEGPGSFVRNLKDLAITNPEGLASRLSGANKSNILEVLGANFPETLNSVKSYHVDSLLDQAARKASGDMPINVNNLVSNINKMSPQVKNLVANPAQHETIDAVSQILEKLKDPTHNWSNTARTIDKLTHNTPSALSFVASLMGHPVTGIASHLAKLGFTEGKDALNLAMLRFMSSADKFEPGAFKAMTQFLHNTAKGYKMLETAIPAVLKPGTQVLTSKFMPSKEDTEKLDKIVTQANENPESLMKFANGQVGYYLPGQQQALTQTAVQTVQYLQKLKPQEYQSGPLDKMIKPDPAQEARYQRALQIAQQPAVILNHIKHGTIQTSDIQDINTMYPALYKQFVQKLSNQMIDMKNDDQQIPYKTKMGLSLFIGQPVDSSMTPSSIMASQASSMTQAQQPQMQQNTDKLGKANNNYMTPSQRSEAHRNKDKS